MSDEQFLRYLEARWEEIQREKRQARMKSDLDSDFGSYRMTSRLACNYAIPPELRVKIDENTTEETLVDKPEVLDALKKDPAKYLSPEALKIYSPKMAQMLADITENVKGFKNQFIYSQYKSLEGLGLFAAILEANGFQAY